MAKQVGPQERKPECCSELRARQGDKGVLGEFHQGPQTDSICNKAGYKTAADLRFTKTRKISCLTGRRPYKFYMTVQREWATPITAGAFMLSAVTGVLMFFNADTGLNKPAHEWLSWALLSGVALHATANFTSLKRHLASRRGQMLVGMFALILFLSFVAPGGKKGPPGAAPMRALLDAPLTTLSLVAKVSPEQMHERLAKLGFKVSSDQQSLSELVGGDMGKQMYTLDMLLAETP
jgi:hypothetical protein